MPGPSTSNPMSGPTPKRAESPRSYYGFLFDSQNNRTKVLDALLRAIGLYIMNNMEEKNRHNLISRQKLALFYKPFPNNDIGSLLLDSPPKDLSNIWSVMGYEHHLVQTSSRSRPTEPALTLDGFMKWMAIQLLVDPVENVPVIQYAVKEWRLRHPETGEPFPPVPASAFPAEPDKSTELWEEHCGNELLAQAKAKERRGNNPPFPDPRAVPGTPPQSARFAPPNATDSAPRYASAPRYDYFQHVPPPMPSPRFRRTASPEPRQHRRSQQQERESSTAARHSQSRSRPSANVRTVSPRRRSFEFPSKNGYSSEARPKSASDPTLKPAASASPPRRESSGRRSRKDHEAKFFTDCDDSGSDTDSSSTSTGSSASEITGDDQPTRRSGRTRGAATTSRAAPAPQGHHGGVFRGRVPAPQPQQRKRSLVGMMGEIPVIPVISGLMDSMMAGGVGAAAAAATVAGGNAGHSTRRAHSYDPRCSPKQKSRQSQRSPPKRYSENDSDDDDDGDEYVRPSKETRRRRSEKERVQEKEYEHVHAARPEIYIREREREGRRTHHQQHHHLRKPEVARRAHSHADGERRNRDRERIRTSTGIYGGGMARTRSPVPPPPMRYKVVAADRGGFYD